MASSRAAATVGRGRVELLVALVGVWATRSYWMPGGVVTSYDGATYSMPNTEVTRSALSAGRVPLINDLIFGGAPHLGNHAIGVFYPPRLIALFVDTATAHGLIVAAHVIWLGVGMVVLARRVGLSPLATAVAGIVAMLVGSTLTKTIQFEQIQPLAWLPWLLVAIDAVGRRGQSRRRVGVLAVVTAMTLLSGHPQLIVEVAVVAGIVAASLLVARRMSIVRLVAGALIGGLVTAVQLAATVAATAFGSLDQGRSFTELANGAFILQGRAAARAVFGTVLDRNPAGFSGSFEAILWLGIIGTCLAVIGAIAGCSSVEQRRWCIPVTVVACLGMVWSLGPRTPLFRIAYEVIPGFDLGRVSARWLSIVGIGASLLVARGVDAVSERWRPRRVGVLGLFGVAGVAVLAFGPFVDELSVAVVWLVTFVALVTALSAAPRHARRRVVVLLLVGELALLSFRSLPGDLVLDEAVGSSVSPAIAELQQRAASGGLVMALTPDGGPHDQLVTMLRPNSNVWFGLRSIDGYDGGVQVTQAWATALRRFTPEPALDMPMRSALSAPVSPSALARLGVRWMVVARDRDPGEWVPDWDGPIAADDLMTVWENPAWIGEAVAWFDSTAPSGAAADELRVMAASLRNSLLVDAKPVACSSDCQPVGLNLVRHSPERLEISVDIDAPAVVTVPMQALPGWRVGIDGIDGDVVEVDGLFLGVVVEPGTHVVEFRYQPWWWWPSVAASITGAVAIGVLFLGRRRRTTW
jgi:hypothetical protein